MHCFLRNMPSSITSPLESKWLSLATFKVINSLLSLRDPRIVLYLCGAAVFDGSLIEESFKSSYLELKELTAIRIADIMQSFSTLKNLIKFENLEPYLVDAQIEGQQWFVSWELWLTEWKNTGGPIELLKADETSLLTVLFDLLAKFHSNPFALNLALTGILAKLVCFCLTMCPSSAIVLSPCFIHSC